LVADNWVARGYDAAMPALALECAARNDIGRRANNEDAIYTSSRLAAVADGVGGAAAGEVASQRIVNSLAHFDTSRLEIPLDAALENAIVFANESIGFMASARPQMEGMSTTLTAVALSNDGTYVVANIGDSRTYLLRAGELTQLSRDDSLVQDLIDAGHLTPEQARRHPARNVVMHALDGDPERRPSTQLLPAVFGDRLHGSWSNPRAAKMLRRRFSYELITAIERTRWWELDPPSLRALARERPDLLFHPTVAGLDRWSEERGQ
jgi:protein phosphatase